MEKKWEDMSTNQLALEIMEMKEKHEAVKREINESITKMISIEKDFIEANKIILNRLNK